MLLQHLKVVLLICGMLVNHKQIRLELGDDESQIELTDDLHFLEHVLALKKKTSDHRRSPTSFNLPPLNGH